MIYSGQAIRVTLIEPGIAELCFDRAGESVNKFDMHTLGELRDAVSALSAQADLRGVLVTSAKEAFIVGADITEFVVHFARPEDELQALVREAAAVFDAVEDLHAATVTAINGQALGGGFEMCLATDYRVMASDAKVGLPEVKLGINPGFGGTVRLPRLIGVDNAVEWIAAGNEKSASAALRDGAVDAVVAADELRESALQLLRDCINGVFDVAARRREKQSPVQLNDIERLMAFTTGKALVAAQAGRHMPAPITAAKSMEKSAGLARAEALAVEAAQFVKLAKTPQSDALVGLFLNDQALSRRNRQFEQQVDAIERIGVLGAGIMGGGIAYQAASKGVAVLMKDIATAGLDQGMAEAGKLLSKRVERGRMAAADMAATLARIRPTLDYQGFEDAQVVVEAVVENQKVKQQVLTECEALLPDDAVLCSNTSTIAIDRLAAGLKRPQQFCGMHFFNPVHRMPLVEVIRGSASSDDAVARVVRLARRMGKTPIVVNDCPGFYVNRVLFPYFGGFSLLLAEGADFREIDRIMERFGWPMGPAWLLDVVGIDTAHHAQQVMAEGFPDRMRFSAKGPIEVMYEADRFGQKNGRGFYRYDKDAKGREQKREDDEALSLLAQHIAKPGNTPDEDTVVARLMVPMCIEAVRCLEEGIVATPGDADMGLAMGIGFPLFRGGALRYIDQMGAAAFCELADRFAALGKLYEPTPQLRRMAQRGGRFFEVGDAAEGVQTGGRA